MYKDHRYINAGTNEFYRWGHKTIEKLQESLKPNEAGFFSVAVDGGNHWTFGTSEGKYGEFIKYKDTFFSVNKAGKAWAKAGSDKAVVFVEMINGMIDAMNAKHMEGAKEEEE